MKLFIKVPKLNQEDMWDIPIPVPCLYEQEKIADFITAIDCSINDNAVSYTHLDVYKRQFPS